MKRCEHGRLENAGYVCEDCSNEEVNMHIGERSRRHRALIETQRARIIELENEVKLLRRAVGTANQGVE